MSFAAIKRDSHQEKENIKWLQHSFFLPCILALQVYFMMFLFCSDTHKINGENLFY